MDNNMIFKKRASFWMRLTLLPSILVLIFLLVPNHVEGQNAMLCTTPGVKYCLKCAQEATSDDDHGVLDSNMTEEWGNCFQPKRCDSESPYNITDANYCTASSTCFIKTLGKQITRGCDVPAAPPAPCPYIKEYPDGTNENNKLTVSWSSNDSAHSNFCSCNAEAGLTTGFCNHYEVYHFMVIAIPKTTTDPDDGGAALEVTFLIFSLTILSVLYNSYM